MNPSHQALLQEKQVALRLFQIDIAKMQRAAAKAQTSKRDLELIQNRWCGIVVELLVSDVLSLIVSHLELAQDMRAFRLTCTHWNQSFCDNTQVFANRFWVSMLTVRSARKFHPFVCEGLQVFFGPLMEPDDVDAPVTLCYNWRGQQSHFVYLEYRYWRMKDGLWMQTKGNRLVSIARRGLKLFDYHICYRNAPTSGENLQLEPLGNILGFSSLANSSYRSYSAGVHTLYLQCTKTERAESEHIPDLDFPDPSQETLLTVQQRVTEMITAAESIRWDVRENRVDERMEDVVWMWGEAIVQRMNSKDYIQSSFSR